MKSFTVKIERTDGAAPPRYLALSAPSREDAERLALEAVPPEHRAAVRVEASPA